MSNASYNLVNDTVINGPALLKTQLANENGAFAVIDNNGAATVLTASHWQAALQGRLQVDTTQANDLDVGPDTVANAKDLQINLGIPNTNDNCLLRILPARNTAATADVDLKTTGGTHVNIDISLAGVDAGTRVLFSNATVGGTNAGSEAIVLVTNTDDTAASESVRFTILQQGGATA